VLLRQRHQTLPRAMGQLRVRWERDRLRLHRRIDDDLGDGISAST
jgi:hypothetical protein